MDNVGYNNITDLARILFGFSNILFVIFMTILLYLIYKTQNKKLIHYTIKFFVFIVCSVPVNDYIRADSEKILSDARIFWIATVD